MTAWLVWLVLGVNLSSPVVRICWVTSGEDMVVRPAPTKPAAGMCVWVLQDCKGAELWLRKTSEAAVMVWTSSDKDQCR